LTMSARALNAILPQVEKSPYEAHQKARTFASRYVKSGQYDTAIDVLFQSARELLKTGQAGSGVDLTVFLLEVYDTKEESVTEKSRGRLTQLLALTGAEGTWRKTLVDKAIVWSAKYGSCPAGDPDLQRYIGELLYKDGDFVAAEPHLLASGQRDSARMLAEMFLQWSDGERFGLFALRGTFPYLLDGNILAARTFIKHFVSGMPKSMPSSTNVISIGEDDEVTMTADSLVNFSQLAVVTCQRANGDQNKVARESWVRLCGTYLSQGGPLAAPEVRKALNEVAILYFAIPPPRTQAVNPFGDMFSSLFGGAAPGQQARRTLQPAGASSTPELD
ncbi:Golgi to ER traffic protein 4, partial [Leucoagaricus sp. SymC.cos]